MSDEITEENYLEVLREQSASEAMRAAGPDDAREALPIDPSDDDIDDADVEEWEISP